MVAYAFKSQFADAIRSGRKFLTLREQRSPRSPHAKVGGLVQLQANARTRKVQQIGVGVCILRASVSLGPDGIIRVRDVTASDRPGLGERAETLRAILTQAEAPMPQSAAYADRLAALDGFKNYADMYAWHAENSAKAKPDKAGRIERELIAWVLR